MEHPILPLKMKWPCQFVLDCSTDKNKFGRISRVRNKLTISELFGRKTAKDWIMAFEALKVFHFIPCFFFQIPKTVNKEAFQGYTRSRIYLTNEFCILSLSKMALNWLRQKGRSSFVSAHVNMQQLDVEIPF